MNEQPIQPTPPIAPPPASNPESQARMWNMLCHISALAGYIIPFGNVLGPILIWQIKKNEFPSVEAHGKAALNFQLTVLIAVIALIIAGFILSLILIGIILFPIAGLVGLCGVIFSIIAGIKANDGKEYKYPYSFQFVK